MRECEIKAERWTSEKETKKEKDNVREHASEIDRENVYGRACVWEREQGWK